MPGSELATDNSENMAVAPGDESLQPEKQDDTSTVIINYDIGAPGDSPASYGSGTLEILEVISLLSDSGIPSCVVGTHPLRYYGAGRVPNVSESDSARVRIVPYDGPLTIQSSTGSFVFPPTDWTMPRASFHQTNMNHGHPTILCLSRSCTHSPDSISKVFILPFSWFHRRITSSTAMN